jgi:NADH dehydrogenase
VVGAGGFVGRHLTDAARARGLEVVGIVHSAAAAQTVLRHGGRPVNVDEFDPQGLAAAFAGARAVVHLAQIGSERGGASFDRINVEGTRRVAEAARKAGVETVVVFSGLGVARYGFNPRCTSRYFLSKLAAEVELYRSDVQAVVFRPSYVVGPGNGFVADQLAALARPEVLVAGDGAYRLQPISVADAAAVVLAAVEADHRRPALYDLVGPEPVSYLSFLERLAAAARGHGLPAAARPRFVTLSEADELDCLLCDEVSDPAPLAGLLARPLQPLDAVLRDAVRGPTSTR